MQVWCDWQVTLCDPHLSALEVRFSRRCAIQIDVYLYLYNKKFCSRRSQHCFVSHSQNCGTAVIARVSLSVSIDPENFGTPQSDLTHCCLARNDNQHGVI